MLDKVVLNGRRDQKAMASSTISVLLVALCLSTSISAISVSYTFTNNAASTSGGQRFDRVIGSDGAKSILSSATSFIFSILYQAHEYPNKNAVSLSLIDKGSDTVAYTSNDVISLSAGYVQSTHADDDVAMKREITGVLYHEMTHVWQWDGKGNAPSGLIEGIADFIRLRADLAPSHWVQAGQGSKWDAGYDVTARFLDYCDNLSEGFVANLNGLMESGWSTDYFQQLLGKGVDQLWSDYKAKYAS